MSFSDGLISIAASMIFVLVYSLITQLSPEKRYSIKKKDVFVTNGIIIFNLAIIFMILIAKYEFTEINNSFYIGGSVLIAVYIWKIGEYLVLLSKHERIYVFNYLFDNNPKRVNEMLKSYKDKYELVLEFKDKYLQIKFKNASKEEIKEMINILDTEGTFRQNNLKSKRITLITLYITIAVLLFLFFSFV